MVGVLRGVPTRIATVRRPMPTLTGVPVVLTLRKEGDRGILPPQCIKRKKKKIKAIRYTSEPVFARITTLRRACASCGVAAI